MTRLPKIRLASTKPLKVQQINWKVRNNVTGGQTNEEQFHGNQVGRIPVGFLLDSCWIPVGFRLDSGRVREVTPRLQSLPLPRNYLPSPLNLRATIQNRPNPSRHAPKWIARAIKRTDEELSSESLHRLRRVATA